MAHFFKKKKVFSVAFCHFRCLMIQGVSTSLGNNLNVNRFIANRRIREQPKMRIPNPQKFWRKNEKYETSSKQRNQQIFFGWGGRHSSMVLSAPTILRPWVRIPSTPSMLFSICIIEIVTRKERK